MYRIVEYFLLSIVSIGLGFSESLEETLASMAKDNAQLYLGPFVTVFGMNVNSGTYHNAKPHKLLGFDLTVGLSITSVTDADKTFDFVLPDENIHIPITIQGVDKTVAINPNDIYDTNRTSSTMFGEATSNSIAINEDNLRDVIFAELATDNMSALEEDILNEAINDADPSSGIEAIPTPSGFDLPTVPMAVPQLSIGLPKDIEISLRGIPAVDIGDMGKFTFSGFGGKIGLNQFIPIPNIALPHISIGYYMTNLGVGDIIEMKNSIATFQLSKSIPFLTVYGGFGLESSSLDVDYTYTDESSSYPVKFTLDGENKFRTTVGARLKLAILTINADYNMGEFNTINVGVGLTLR